MPAHGCLLAGLDERRGAEIDRDDVGKNADCRDHCGAQEPNDYDLQMRAAVRALHRMVHSILPGCADQRRGRGKRVSSALSTCELTRVKRTSLSLEQS